MNESPRLRLRIAAICSGGFIVSGMLFCVVRVPTMVSTVLAIAMAVFVVLTLAFFMAALFESLRTAILALSLVAAFGFFTGYLGAYVGHRESENYSDCWYDLFSFPGVPGDLITNQIVFNGADWCMGESWDYRFQVAGWNACFWTGLGIILGVPIYFISRRNKHETA